MYLKQIVHTKGAFFEVVAANLLRLKGYRILGRNKKMGGVEVDILATKQNILVVVEVKYRRKQSKGHVAIHPKQKHRLQGQAAQLMGQFPQFQTVRLDVVLFFPHRPFVEHIKNAQFAY